MYNVGNGFQQISLLQQLKYHSILLRPFPELTPVAGQIWLEKEVTHQKGIQNKLEKGGSNS